MGSLSLTQVKLYALECIEYTGTIPILLNAKITMLKWKMENGKYSIVHSPTSLTFIHSTLIN